MDPSKNTSNVEGGSSEISSTTKKTTDNLNVNFDSRNGDFLTYPCRPPEITNGQHSDINNDSTINNGSTRNDVNIVNSYVDRSNISQSNVQNCNSSQSGETSNKYEDLVSNRQGNDKTNLRQMESCEENSQLPYESNASNLKSADNIDATSSNIETERSCSKYKSCQDKNFPKLYEACGSNSLLNINVPSSSTSACKSMKFERKKDESVKHNRKRPAHARRRKHHNVEGEDSSSDTGNDDYSVGSEEGCIYTYRGGEHLADLPSSFFSLDMGVPVDHHLPIPPLFGVREAGQPEARVERVSRASSPEMDFLEMDFDPGPSCEADSNDMSVDVEFDEDSINIIYSDEDSAEVLSPEGSDDVDLEDDCDDDDSSTEDSAEMNISEKVETSKPSIGKTGQVPNATDPYLSPKPSTSRDYSQGVLPTAGKFGDLVQHTDTGGNVVWVRRTTFRWHGREPAYHLHNGELISTTELIHAEIAEPTATWSKASNKQSLLESSKDCSRENLSSAHYHLSMAKKLMLERPNNTFLDNQDPDTSNVEPSSWSGDQPVAVPVPPSFLWPEREASERQVTQIATSACGATAVINALRALGLPAECEHVAACVETRARAGPGAPLPRYLLSRALAGCTARELMEGVARASQGAATARFFPTYPERAVSLSHWISNWILLGAVPILTLNLQARVAERSLIPDAWHHQMVFGVSPRGICLTNPLECVEESVLWHRLVSDSVLLVRTRDVASRWNCVTDLSPLMTVPGDPRWQTMNVLGQVVNVLRESRDGARARTTHVRLPASYCAGITVIALTGSEAHRRLTRAPDLPLHPPQ